MKGHCLKATTSSTSPRAVADPGAAADVVAVADPRAAAESDAAAGAELVPLNNNNNPGYNQPVRLTLASIGFTPCEGGKSRGHNCIAGPTPWTKTGGTIVQASWA